VRTVCDEESRQGEVKHIIETFKRNGYYNQTIQEAPNTRNRLQKTTEKPTGVALLPYRHPTSNKISRLIIIIIVITWRYSPT
jgi:hypothetical protein